MIREKMIIGKRTGRNFFQHLKSGGGETGTVNNDRHPTICQGAFKKGQQMGPAAFSVSFCCTNLHLSPYLHSIRSNRRTKVVFPDFLPMRVSEEPFCILRENPVFTSLHLRSPVHVVQPSATAVILG
jgi:hypothetical protein